MGLSSDMKKCYTLEPNDESRTKIKIKTMEANMSRFLSNTFLLLSGNEHGDQRQLNIKVIICTNLYNTWEN